MLQVRLPELALLRFTLIDAEEIAQRTVPLHALRNGAVPLMWTLSRSHRCTGYRHVSLRDARDAPLAPQSLFVHFRVTPCAE
jgi:hypothetical protein